ncbi:MAG: methyltransferase domain-containing protein [bacterium]|nr:methyltransferase domain-containing protein [bacterium]
MSFDLASEYYDLMIDWNARLAREMPFYQSLFGKYRIKTVLDCACSTGRHAVAFAKSGYAVVGSDISYEMLEIAQQHANKEKEAVDFVHADFKRLSEYIPCQFDAVICVGNSLVQLQNQKEVLTTLHQMRNALNPNGILIIQILNFQRLINQHLAPMPLRTARVKGKELLFLRLYSFPTKQKARLNVITLAKHHGKWEMNQHTTEMMWLTKPGLQNSLRSVGFRNLHFYGDFKFSPFNENTSSDLIIAAQR